MIVHKRLVTWSKYLHATPVRFWLNSSKDVFFPTSLYFLSRMGHPGHNQPFAGHRGTIFQSFQCLQKTNKFV